MSKMRERGILLNLNSIKELCSAYIVSIALLWNIAFKHLFGHVICENLREHYTENKRVFVSMYHSVSSKLIEKIGMIS